MPSPPTARGTVLSSLSPIEELHALYGVTPDKKCGECDLLRRYDYHGKRYYKCSLRRITHGAATDHRFSWAACGRFEEWDGLE